MSKIYDHLHEVNESREMKYTMVLQNAVPPTASPAPAFPEKKDVAQPQPDIITIERGVFNLGLACVVFMGVISLILSFKAFQQIQRGNDNLLKLSRVILKQEARLESLANAVEGQESRGGGLLATLETDVKAMKDTLIKGNKEVMDMAVNMNLFQVEIDDLKAAQQELFTKMVEMQDRQPDLSKQ